jgi:glycosyltransferase involved in cell wall biosynthesis
MKIVHVISGLQKAAGTSTFCGEVCNQLVALGHDVTIAVCNPSDPNIYPLDPRIRLVSIASILHSTPTPTPYTYSLVHIHGLWSWPLQQVSSWACAQKIPVVWSTHGMLTPWALKNKWWKKLPGLALYQYWSLRKADLIHVTAQSEVDDVRRLGLKNEVVIAPLGVRVKEGVGDRCRCTEDNKTLLFVSRVQRKKGLPNLLEAWTRLPEDLKKDWTIRIVGPDQDNHTAELMSQCEHLGLTYTGQDGKFRCAPASSACTSTRPQVAFVGPKYDADLDAEYSNADLFVLPTHSENFGSVVIEALAHSIPVICTKEAPWEELETHKCGWWIDDNVDALENALRDALDRVERGEQCAMGQRGLELVKAKYDWSVIGRTLSDAYSSLVNGCKKGRCVDCPELYDACSP